MPFHSQETCQFDNRQKIVIKSVDRNKYLDPHYERIIYPIKKRLLIVQCQGH